MPGDGESGGWQAFETKQTSRLAGQSEKARATFWTALVVFCVLLGFGVYIVLGGPLPIEDESEETTPELDEEEAAALAVETLNQERAERGLSELETNEQLAAVAYNHSQDMAEREYYAHETPEGVGPNDRVRQNVPDCLAAGENIAATWWQTEFDSPDGIDEHTTVEELADGLIEQWLQSPEHRDNMLESQWEETGVGIVVTDENEVIATQKFCR